MRPIRSVNIINNVLILIHSQSKYGSVSRTKAEKKTTNNRVKLVQTISLGFLE